MDLHKAVSTKTSTLALIAASAFCLYVSALLYLTDTETQAAQVLAVKHPQKVEQLSNMVTIKTNMGDIEIELLRDKAPTTVANFTKLVSNGFYDGIKFHRVIKNFMIQAGDPLSKDEGQINRWGQGGPGYTFADEINKSDELYKIGYVRGVVAMANAGPNTNGSQFFIMHRDNNLPANYTIFGHVKSGMEVVDKIAEVPTYMPGKVDRPLSPIVIEKIILN